MRTALVITILALAACARTGVPRTAPVTRAMPAPEPFRVLVVEGGIELHVDTGKDPSLEVKGEPGQLAALTIAEKDGTLRIHAKPLPGDHDAIVVRLTARELESVTVRGAVNGNVDALAGAHAKVVTEGASNLTIGKVRSGDVHVEAEGASRVEFAGEDVKTIDIRAVGASRVTAKAACDTADVKAYGASNVARGLSAKTVTATAAGASSIDVDVSELLHATASGASSVRYGGSPKVEQDETGASHVAPR